MKKIIIAAFCLFSAFAANSQKLDKGLLWKISGNGITKPSYIFGTIHITCDATLEPNVVKALNETKQLYLELDMDDPNMQTAMMATITMKDGKTLSSMLSADDFKTLDDFIKKQTGMPATAMNTFKPFIASSFLLPKMLDCPMQSYEGELVKATKAQNEEIFGLETVEYQMGVFDAIPYDVQLGELLKSAKDDMAGDKKEFADMMAIYKTKDLNALYMFMANSDNKMYSAYNDVLLNNRNKNWIPKIEQVAKATPTFFGVGAAHLAGENGVIMLLRKKGYKIEAVN